MRSSRAIPLAGLVLGGLLLVACGDDDDGGSAVPENPNLTVEAHDIRFDRNEYAVTGPEVRVLYVSRGRQVHTLVVERDGDKIGETLRVNPGDRDGGVYTLEPGTYELICDVPGHAAAGMTATLTVDG